MARYQKALVSQNIVMDYIGQPVMIPGFIVPVEFDEQKRVTHFFLVPYFGACIHLPPPPPNQVIYATHSKGIEQKELYQPYWISGVLKTVIVENETATSAYQMDVDAIRMYTEEDDQKYSEMQQAQEAEAQANGQTQDVQETAK